MYMQCVSVFEQVKQATKKYVLHVHYCDVLSYGDNSYFQQYLTI